MLTRRARLWILAMFTLSCIVLSALVPRVAQNPAYHEFADQREFFGIPNCLNVISNLPFLIVGALGLAFLFPRNGRGVSPPFLDARERWPYAVFFVGVALTSAGSSYYHLAPNNGTLVWDRLPMTFAFMSFFAAVVMERVSLQAGLWLLPAVVLIGIGSVAYWNLTEMRGVGDLRPYGFVQAYPLLGVPLLIVLFPPRYTRTGDLLWVGGIYVVAKLLEWLDRPIFDLGHVVSGHTLKHLAASLSAYWAVRMLKLRRPLAARAAEMASAPGTGALT